MTDTVVRRSFFSRWRRMKKKSSGSFLGKLGSFSGSFSGGSNGGGGESK